MTEPRLLSRKQVETLFGLSRSYIYASMTRGEFPRPIDIGPAGAKRATVRWRMEDLLEWENSRHRAAPEA